MTEAEFKRKTRGIGLEVIALFGTLPRTRPAEVIGRQMLRSATSIGANYRAACRAQSPRDMLAKLADVEEEADETLYWLELLVEANIVAATPAMCGLQQNVEEVLRMVIASIRTLRARALQSKIRDPKSKVPSP